jgi:hypothetical protein
MGLESMAIAGLTALGWQTARQTMNYGSNVAGGAIGVKVLKGTIDGFEKTGSSYFGTAGAIAGRILGKAVAGQALPEIKAQADNISNIGKKIGTFAIDYASGASNAPGAANQSKEPQKAATQMVSADGSVEEVANVVKVVQQPSKLLSLGKNIGKVAMPLLGAAVVATGVIPVAGIGLVGASAAAFPKIAESIMSAPKLENGQDSVEDILVGGAKAFIKESAGIIAGNYVKADQILKAYNLRVDQGRSMGQTIGNWFPTPIGNCFVKAGEYLGTLDANRYAMSDEVVQNAMKAGEAAESITKTSIGIATAVVSQKLSQPSGSTWWDTARKAAWIGGGILTAATVVAVAPEVAPFIASTSLISVADKVVDWAKGRLLSPQESPVEKSPVETTEKQAETADETPVSEETPSESEKSQAPEVLTLSDSQVEALTEPTA